MKTNGIMNTIMAVSWLLGFVLSLLVIFAIYESTFEYAEDRATFNKGDVVGWINNEGDLAVVFKRDFTIHKAGDMDIIRTISCTASNGDVSEYTMPPVRRKFEAKYYPAKTRYFATPMRQSVGDACRLIAHILWYPRLSLHGKLVVIADESFVVQEKRP